MKRCKDRDMDGARCGAVEGHAGRHSWHASVEQLWDHIADLESAVKDFWVYVEGAPILKFQEAFR